MRFAYALGACLLSLVPFAALAQQTAESQPASITGTVIDVRHDPVPFAAVALDGPTPASHSVTTANDQGVFAFKNLSSDIPYHLTITAKGFTPRTTSAITLKPGQELDLGKLELAITVVQTTVTAMTTEQIATQEVHIEETQRVLGIFPNFYVAYTPDPVPLTAKLKFQLALRTSIDPINILGTAAFAAINQAGDTPNYPQGAKGYAQRFGAGYTDGFTDIMIGGAILPSILHQDPRYFYQGTGTVKARIRHAVAFAVMCKGDDGGWQFNYSSLGGDLASGAISNLYYPSSNRGPGLVFYNALLSAGGRVVDNLAQEFLFRRFTPSAKKQP